METVRDHVQRALQRPNGALNEYESLSIMRRYGLPATDAQMVAHAADVAEAARGTGFPVVVKAVGHALLHKSERQLVHLNLENPLAAADAARQIEITAGGDLEGFLIQPQCRGRREFMAGMFRDRQFGPVLMFGLGGIHTEALADNTCRLAPIHETDAFEMFDEIRASAMLGALRGDAPVNRNALAELLLGLSRLVHDFPQIAEIDLNPIVIQSDGTPCIVDALIVCRPPLSATRPSAPIDPQSIGALFYPRSVAFIGASERFGKWGQMLVANTVGSGFEGKCYFVNPKGGTMFGQPVYPDTDSLPETVDLAVVTVPAAKVLGLLPQLERKQIRHVLLISSGFAETNDEGRALEAQLTAAARKAGILILGPNTMGICNPHVQFFCTGSPVAPQAGSTAVVAQSGNMGTQLLAFAEKQGIGIRGFAGSGNEAMLTIEDFLDGFEVDELTRTVMLYVESVKDGRRFFESARRVGRLKPIVLLKGGQSEAGHRAASSHTGAMASDSSVFSAMCLQAGIIKVDQPMQLLDLSAAFASLPLPRGNRAAIMTLGGGWGVVTADLCARNGLEVPELDPRIVAELDRLLPAYWSRSNPVDLVGENDLKLPLTAMEMLLAWDGCDGVINLGILGRRIFVQRLAANSALADPGQTMEKLAPIEEAIIHYEKRYIEQVGLLSARYEKPVFGVSLLQDEDDRTVYPVENCPYKAVFYETPERAVSAFSKMVRYRRFLDRVE